MNKGSTAKGEFWEKNTTICTTQQELWTGQGVLTKTMTTTQQTVILTGTQIYSDEDKIYRERVVQICWWVYWMCFDGNGPQLVQRVPRSTLTVSLRRFEVRNKT